MNNEPTDPRRGAPTECPDHVRKAYEPPVLVELGALVDLTGSGAAAVAERNGGSQP